MTVRIVRKIEKLKDRCDEINVFENQELIKETTDLMLEYLNKHTEVNALIAPQISKQVRLFAIRFADGIKFFVNPMFTKQEGLHANVETNISLPDRTFLVMRNDKVGIAYQDLFGIAGEIDFDGTTGDLVQQQVHMLDGVTLDDIGLEVFDDFLNASEEEQQEVIDFYVETLKERNKTLADEIENDPDLKQYKEGMDFLQAAARGEVEIEGVKLSNKKQRRLDKWIKKLKHKGQNYTKKKKKRK